MEEAFELADSILKHTVEGITNIIFNNGTINLDFNDLKSTLKDKGYGLFGIGIAKEEETIIDAVEKAMCSPLLDTNITGASNILLNTAGRIDIVALNKAVSYIREQAGDGVNIFWGTVSGDPNSSEVVVTLIATGMKQVQPAQKTKLASPPTEMLPKPITPEKVLSATEFKIDVLGKAKTANDVKMLDRPEVKTQVKPVQLQIPEFLKHNNR
jgi:cell division protein FtsZ